MNSAANDNPQSLLGNTLGNSYVFDRILGQGRHGTLFDARHARLGSRFAVRVVRTDTQRRNALLAMLSQHGSLSHPHLNPPRDLMILPDDQLLLASPLLPGQDLNQRVAQHGKLTASEGLVVLRQAVAALHALHQKGLCHGNLNASNLYFTRYDDVSIENALGDSKGSHIVQLIDPGLSLLDGTQATAFDDQRALGRMMLAFVADLSSAQRRILERTQDGRPEARYPNMAELWRTFQKTIPGLKGEAAQAGSIATTMIPKVEMRRAGLRRRAYVVVGAGLLGLLAIAVVAGVSGRKAIQQPAPLLAPSPAAPAAPVAAPPPVATKPGPQAPAAVAPAAPTEVPSPPEERPAKPKKKKGGKAKKKR